MLAALDMGSYKELVVDNRAADIVAPIDILALEDSYMHLVASLAELERVEDLQLVVDCNHGWVLVPRLFLEAVDCKSHRLQGHLKTNHSF